MKATGGRGVNVVVNSLQGPLLEKSLSCLAPYGRFIELGKRDVYADSEIGMRRLASNISLHVLDLASMLTDRPGDITMMMAKLLPAFDTGELQPLPIRAFSADEVSQAFRAFSASDHIGKIVVDLREAPRAIRQVHAKVGALDGSGTYLVTGGTSGFGLSVGRWLAAAGAGRVVLASRSGEIADGAALSDLPSNIELLRLNVTDFDAVRSEIRSLVNGAFPLRGIITVILASL